jgi:uncharacterized membrane protein YidH (DUF202 family)
MGIEDEGLDLRFCERFHESLESRKVISSLIILFQIVKMKLCLKRWLNLKREMQGIGLTNEGMHLRFCKKFHESLNNTKVVGSLVIFFQIVKLKLCLKYN